MSYYKADYYRNPVPYTSSDIDEPVPGWGLSPKLAGPARVAVGCGCSEGKMIGCSGCSGHAGVGSYGALQLTPEQQKQLAVNFQKASEPFPTWGYFAIAGAATVVLVGGALYLKSR